MPRGRIIVFGVVIALVSVGLTLAAVFLLLPVILGQTGQGISDDRNGTGQARETAFDPNDRIQILVALQNLPRGFEIPSNAYNNAVGVREFPAASVPRDAIVVENID